MELRGWNYVGRVINDETLETIKNISIQFRDEVRDYNLNWGPELQEKIGKSTGVNTAGQVRTFKRLMERLGIIKEDILNAKSVPDFNTLYTDDGKLFLILAEISDWIKIENKPNKDSQLDIINESIKFIILKNLLNYALEQDTGEVLHPARAILRALNELDSLDQNEWYFLNDSITKDNDEAEWKVFLNLVRKYRSGELESEEIKVVEKGLSHSYILSSFVYVDLIVKYNDSNSIKRYKLNTKKEVISNLIIKQEGLESD